MTVAVTSSQRRWLQALLADKVVFDTPMAQHTWLRVGGPADALAAPATIDEARALIAWARDENLAWMAIGDGTNLLVHDAGIRGLVIVTRRLCDSLSVRQVGRDRVEVQAGAGVRLQHLCRLAVAQHLAGLTFATGIPGTLGGAIRMNAGTGGGCIGDALRAVGVIDAAGNHHWLQRRDLVFGYRRLNRPAALSPGPWLLAAARLDLMPADGGRLGALSRQVMDRRRASQPLDAASAGCFFKNPPCGPGAGRLIDLAGLKGLNVGDAEVSRRHANFIVNNGRARAADVWALAQQVRAAVRDQFNVVLEPEVQLVGFPQSA